MIRESVPVGVSIERPVEEVYAFCSTPANLPVWASGLAEAPVELVDGRWVVTSPMGRVTVVFAACNSHGVLDHVVTLPDGEEVLNPMRVVANGDGCDVVFSVRRTPGASDADFARDVATVQHDLQALRAVLEAPSRG